MNTKNENCEPAKVCPKCGDKLTGHEDENGTLCRFCLTYQPVDETGTGTITFETSPTFPPHDADVITN